MYSISKEKVTKMTESTFAELGMKESDIEELLRNNVEMINEEEDSMLIVGQQVRNAQHGISDLTAIDQKGNIVLIEIKRDLKDIIGRKEAFEFQAIRYAASYATIKSPEELIAKIYAPYIEKYKNEFTDGKLTSIEIATRELNEFLEINEIDNEFNNRQRIMLVASDFDEQTLSAVAWLNSNQVDISCHKLIPYQIGEDIFLHVKKILPVDKYEDYYVDFLDSPLKNRTQKKAFTRRVLPKIDKMIKWGVVKEGDTVIAKGRENEATLLPSGNVLVAGEEMSMQKWLKDVFGWSSVQTYVFAVHKATNKSLSEIREEYMEMREKEELDF